MAHSSQSVSGPTISPSYAQVVAGGSLPSSSAVDAVVCSPNACCNESIEKDGSASSQPIPEGAASPTDGQGPDGSGDEGADDDDGSNPGRGGQENFEGPVLDYLKEYLPRYQALEKGRKAKESFFRDFVAGFFSKFPLEEYPPPPRKPLPPLPLRTPEQLAAMTAKQRKSYKRKLAVRSRTAKEHMTICLKNWFRWHAGGYRRKDSIAVSQFLSTVKTNMTAPRRRIAGNVVMSHPDFKDDVKNLSLETGSDDRLACRKRAAAQFLELLDEEKRDKVSEIIQSDYDKRCQRASVPEDNAEKTRYRDSFGNIMQHIINVWTAKTGLKIVVLAGEDLDGNNQFDSVVLSSGGPLAENIENFDVSVHDEFVRYFYRWLRDIRVKEQTAEPTSSSNDPSRESVPAFPECSAPSSTMGQQCQQSSSSTSTSTECSPSLPIPVPASDLSRSSSSTEHSPSQPTPVPTSDLSSSNERPEELNGEKSTTTEKPAGELESGGIVIEESTPAVLRSEQPAKKRAMTLQTALARLEAGKPLTVDELFTMCYDDQRTYNIADVNSKLDALGLRGQLTSSGPFAVGQKTRPKPRSVATKSSDASVVVQRRSSRLNPNAGQLPSAHVERSLTSSGEDYHTLALRALMDARAGFLEFDGEGAVAALCDVVNEMTSEGSIARAEWHKHVSDLIVEGDEPRMSIPEPPLHLKPDDGFVWKSAKPISPTVHPIHTDPSSHHLELPSSLPSPPVVPVAPEISSDPDHSSPISTSPLVVSAPPGTLAENVQHIPSSSVSTLPIPTLDSVEPDVPMQGIETVVDNAELGIARSNVVVEAYRSFVIPTIPFDNGEAPGDYDHPYVQELMSFLRKDVDGLPKRPGIWHTCIYLWGDLECMWADLGLSSKAAPVDGRPIGFSTWNKAGRFRPASLRPPKTASLDNLRQVWWQWWSDMNPEWCPREGIWLLPAGEGDWSEMEWVGKDGLVLCLVGLKWWYDLGGGDDVDGMWMEALKSVYSTMSTIVADIIVRYKDDLAVPRSDHNRKRKGMGLVVSDPKRPRRR